VPRIPVSTAIQTGSATFLQRCCVAQLQYLKKKTSSAKTKDGTSGKMFASDTRGMDPEPIKSPTRCQRLTTVATLMNGPCRRDGHHSLVIPKRVLSEYNKDLIFC